MIQKKYLLLKECLNWHQAAKRCNNLKSRLALPKNMDENEDFLADALKSEFGYSIKGYYGFWIAVTETPEGGSWVDDQGQTVTFTNWDDGYPMLRSNATHYTPTAVIILNTGFWRNVPSEWKDGINALCA